MTIFYVSVIAVAVIALGLVFKVRKMPKYKIIKEFSIDGKEKWFVKIRKGLSYYYLEQTNDLPGYENDVFAISKYQSGGQDTDTLAEKIIYNHKMTTVNGLEEK